MSVLIFGASGFLGRELRNYFVSKREAVLATYFTNKQSGLIHFDLNAPDLSVFGSDLKNVSFAICSATTQMDRCKTEWALTHKAHVKGTISLISQLQDANIVPIFISTDYVYDGTRGNYSEDDVRVPVLAYGRQKKEVEDYLLGQDAPYLIVRFGKIYSVRERDKTILTAIADDLRQGKDVHLATDQIFNPSYVHDICRALDLLMDQRCLGCYNVCVDTPISRFDLGALVKSRLGIATGCLIPCALSDFAFEDNRPLNTSMSNRQFVEVTGFRFTTIEESLERLKSSLVN